MVVEGARMRSLLSALLILLPTTTAHAATRNFGIEGFEKVRVDGPFKVTLTTGVAPFAQANGSPQAIDRVAMEIRGNILVVHNSGSSWGGYPGRDAGPVEIVLGTHDLSSAWVNGSGSLSINKVRGLSFDFSVQGSALGEIGSVAVDQLSINLVGTANARLSGEAGKATAVVRGVSSLDAAKLTMKDAVITADGAATVDATVTNAVKIYAVGPATIRLTGNPACTLQASGSASVSGCKPSQ
jgi:hypothetical protein